MNVNSWLKKASQDIDRLDAELILAHTVGQDRVFLHAHGDQKLSAEQRATADALKSRRQKHEPLAYLLGTKEFYGRDFLVTPDVLIPRPETEALIYISKNYATSFPAQHPDEPLKIIDLGTGSACIAVTLACELSAQLPLDLTATDISSKALECAQYNANRHHQKSISLIKSDLFKSKQLKGQKFHLIVANLPYVDRTWPWLSDSLKYEPKIALFAKDYGLALIKKLLKQAQKFLEPDGILVLEMDVSQQQQILDYIDAEDLPYMLTTDFDSHFSGDQSPQSLALVLRLRH